VRFEAFGRTVVVWTKLTASGAFLFYIFTLIITVVSFTTEYNLAQGIVMAFLGTITFGLALVLTITAIVLRLAKRSG
jgi:hypothetical protein